MSKENSLHIVIDSLPVSTTNIIDILSALLVPVIAIVGIVIAYQQYKINQQRLKHELYERRLIIFKHMKMYLSEILRRGTITYDRAMEFNYDTSESTFLLDKIINEKIREIYTKSIDMASLNEQMYPSNGGNGLPVGEERTIVAHEHALLLKWLIDQLTELKPLFSKHLALHS